jgi:GxxExxY protein
MEESAASGGLVHEHLSEQVIGAAIEVHRELGPGLLESTYEACLLHELTCRGLEARSQVTLPVMYKGVRVDCGYRLDLLVESLVVIELKAVDRLDPIHEAQLITYLRLSGLPLGLLINFNVRLLKNGIVRRANTRPPPRPPRSPR